MKTKIFRLLRRFLKFMSNKNVWEKILLGVCLIGGAVLVDKMFKKEYRYKCPSCGYDELKWEEENECPICKTKLKWIRGKRPAK